MTNTTTIPDGAYILVADGTGARIFSASTEDDNLSLSLVDTLEPNYPKHNGPSGVRPPEQTPDQTEEATFAKHAAKAVNAMAIAGKFDHLVVIADPQTIGQMREVFHEEVTDRISCEMPKTLTNLSKNELEEYLSSS